MTSPCKNLFHCFDIVSLLLDDHFQIKQQITSTKMVYQHVSNGVTLLSDGHGGLERCFFSRGDCITQPSTTFTGRRQTPDTYAPERRQQYNDVYDDVDMLESFVPKKKNRESTQVIFY